MTLIYYVLLRPIMIFLFSLLKSLKLYIKHYVIKTEVVRHKNKNQFVMNPCLEIRFIVFVKGYFIRPSYL